MAHDCKATECFCQDGPNGRMPKPYLAVRAPTLPNPSIWYTGSVRWKRNETLADLLALLAKEKCVSPQSAFLEYGHNEDGEVTVTFMEKRPDPEYDEKMRQYHEETKIFEEAKTAFEKSLAEWQIQENARIRAKIANLEGKLAYLRGQLK